MTFAAQHPDWRTILYTDCDPGEVPGVEVREIKKPEAVSAATWEVAHAPERSDLWRYHWLSTEGGVYSDTDIIYYGSIEPLIRDLDDRGCESGITQDSGYRPHGRGSLALSIGVLSSHAGGRFFGRLFEHLAREGSLQNDNQSFGVVTIHSMWSKFTSGIEVGNIPGRLFYGKFSFSARRHESQRAIASVWKGGVPLSPEAVALHWFGSSEHSVRAGAEDITKDTICMYSKTPVGLALSAGMNGGSRCS